MVNARFTQWVGPYGRGQRRPQGGTVSLEVTALNLLDRAQQPGLGASTPPTSPQVAELRRRKMAKVPVTVELVPS